MKKFLLSCAVLLLAVGGAYAQSYIFINSEKVFKSQNDYNTAIQQLDDLAKQYQKNVDDAYQTLEEAYSNYQAQKNYLSETKRAAKEQEIVELEKEAGCVGSPGRFDEEAHRADQTDPGQGFCCDKPICRSEQVHDGA